MGLLNMVKGLLGSTGVTELAAATGMGEHLETLADVAQQPAEELGSLATEAAEAANPLMEGP